LQRHIKGTEDLIDYINNINGSFDNAKKALSFAAPLFNMVRFSKPFIRAYDSEEEDEDADIRIKTTSQLRKKKTR
jgi:hypothetical protein